jgi:hypothetical protein
MGLYQFVLDFIREFSDRKILIREFNEIARLAFVNEEAPRLLKSRNTMGDSSYKHSNSRRFFSGFRIDVKMGPKIKVEEIKFIGTIFLNNRPLLRQLMALGYDTIEVYGGDVDTYMQWNISSYANLDGYFLE